VSFGFEGLDFVTNALVLISLGKCRPRENGTTAWNMGPQHKRHPRLRAWRLCRRPRRLGIRRGLRSCAHVVASGKVVSGCVRLNYEMTAIGLANRSPLTTRFSSQRRDHHSVACGGGLYASPQQEGAQAIPKQTETQRGPTRGIWFNDHIEEDGSTVFKHACKLGLEGIVSKRKDSPYRSGRSPDWLKMKNPACAAVKREEEEDWGRR
jgi:hypothetical protein